MQLQAVPWTGTLPRAIPAVPGLLQRREGTAIKVGGIWGGSSLLLGKGRNKVFFLLFLEKIFAA